MPKHIIKKGDTVEILTGKDNGKTGKVIRVNKKQNTVVVEGLNMYKRHQRARKAGQKGEIVEFARAIHRSNVMHVDVVASRAQARKKRIKSK